MTKKTMIWIMGMLFVVCIAATAGFAYMLPHWSRPEQGFLISVWQNALICLMILPVFLGAGFALVSGRSAWSHIGLCASIALALVAGLISLAATGSFFALSANMLCSAGFWLILMAVYAGGLLLFRQSSKR